MRFLRTTDKLEKCQQLGLNEAILTTKYSNFAENIKSKTDGKGVDVILDLVGASVFITNLESLALKGRIVLVGLVGGRSAGFDLGLALQKRARIIGTVLRSRPTAEKAEATKKFIEEVLPLIADGTVKPNLDKVFPIEEVRKAHEYLESNESFGKVVLEF